MSTSVDSRTVVPQNLVNIVNSMIETKDYNDMLSELGYVNKENPTRILIYPKDFEAKDIISEEINSYNSSQKEEDKISYSDMVGVLMSSVTTIVNAISYVLIAFVAISLIVSSIMIGIITYISVLERTKEIGILRAIGASKKDVSRVFNAETLIVGFGAGLIGILVSPFFILIINIILHALTDIAALSAVLPFGAAVILILISKALTLVAGLIPSRVAAKKDPVIALRTE
jgi:putative ABC transport system permease protein